MENFLYIASVWALPLLLAITLHEAAHGYAASRLGDDTAKQLGRVTLNPFRHVDPVGTILLPAVLLVTRAPFLFGWAKPVPVDFGRLRDPRSGMVLVAAAGPATNLVLAFLSAAGFYLVEYLPSAAQEWAAWNLANSLTINLILAVFNMLPLPPLDGGRVAVGLLPYPLAWRLSRLERFGFFILIGAMFLLPWLGQQVGLNLNVFYWLVGMPMEWLRGMILSLLGLV
ncbi:site-2 protease family protein [Telmatospirillum sp. J64-1]|uniref:site-2 protease family protein n=1 Tax=Telmatospirillum sp. J64-1 TaxID=2502183 RepID=UPI00115CD63D|nr:site-2 protease family protein [Telmatospirillum sp. J64-1]